MQLGKYTGNKLAAILIMCAVAFAGVGAGVASIIFSWEKSYSFTIEFNPTLGFYLDETCLIPWEGIESLTLGNGGTLEVEFWIRNEGDITPLTSFIKDPVNIYNPGTEIKAVAWAIDTYTKDTNADGIPDDWQRWHALNNPDGSTEQWYMDDEWGLDDNDDPDLLHCRINIVEDQGINGVSYSLLLTFQNDDGQ